MAPSLFTYSVSRPYPYRWFTPVSLGGGLLFLALFSWLNFVATGFELRYISRKKIFVRRFSVSDQADSTALCFLKIRMRPFLIFSLRWMNGHPILHIR
jgi:hypothetical protein